MQDNSAGQGRPRTNPPPPASFATRAGDLLRRLRDDAGLTGRQLAERSGVPYETLNKYERGVRAPSLEAAGKLAAALGHSLAVLDALFGDGGGGGGGEPTRQQPTR